MKAKRRFLGLGVIVYLLLATVVFSGMLGSALASVSEPLILENATGETLTVGSVSLVNDGTNLIIKFVTEAEYPLFYTVLTFRGNDGGITRAMSTGRTEYLTHKSDNNHTYTIPLTLIKIESVEIAASADVIVDGKVTNTRKAFITVFFRPSTTVTTAPTTTTTAPTTTTTTEATTTTTTSGGGNGTTTTTTSGGGNGGTTTTTRPSGGNGGTTTTTTSGGGNGGTTTTVAPGQVTTTVAGATTTTTIQPVSTTVLAKVTREGLPFTGTNSNLYLGGLLLMLTGAGMFLGSLNRSKE